MSLRTIRRALLSVSDKTGLADLARALHELGVELISTGGARACAVEAGIPVRDIADVTGFPEILDGRVKTLHPRVHAGLLAVRDNPTHSAVMREQGIEPIDMVVSNLYPFEAVSTRAGSTPEEIIENIDIGGPSMIRSAAKNYRAVAVLTEPGQYPAIIEELRSQRGALSLETRERLAAAAFARTAAYDSAIAAYFADASWPGLPTGPQGSTAGLQSAGDLRSAAVAGSGDPATTKDPATTEFPVTLNLRFDRLQNLRYGENPHQPAAFYVEPGYMLPCVSTAATLHGKELSFNNLLDLDSALNLVRDFSEPAAVVIKHNNPCGAAVGVSLAEAFHRAYDGDPLSAYGGVLGFNREVDEETARLITEPNRFIECIIAPSYSEAAFQTIVTRPSWKKNVRVLKTGPLAESERRKQALDFRRIEGGLLVQARDLGSAELQHLRVVTQRAPSERELADLRMAWLVGKHVKSNAIVLAKDGMVVGVGAGQMSRVDSVHLAVRKAADRAAGSVLASDAFFPFRDNIDEAAQAGITAVIQPGGSMRDQDSIQACDEHGLAMVLTGVRHFRH